MAQLERERLAEDREILGRLLGGARARDQFTEDNFAGSPGTAEAFAACRAFDPVRENLYLHGPTGTGKSHLAAVAARRHARGRNWENVVRTVTPMAFSRMLRRQKDAEGEGHVLDDLARVPVLVLDDLGVQKDTDFLLSALYEVVHLRYQAGAGGLVVTSNLSLGDLAAKMNDDRISSRLSQMCQVFSLVGVPDHRVPEKKK